MLLKNHAIAKSVLRLSLECLRRRDDTRSQTVYKITSLIFDSFVNVWHFSYVDKVSALFSFTHFPFLLIFHVLRRLTLWEHINGRNYQKLTIFVKKTFSQYRRHTRRLKDKDVWQTRVFLSYTVLARQKTRLRCKILRFAFAR